MRTRDEVIEHYRYELLGIVCDALRNKEADAALALRLDMYSARIKHRLGQIYDELTRKTEPVKQTNGRPAVPAMKG